MFEGTPTQAQGLHQLFSTHQIPERLVSVVLQSSDETELGLYWTLCKVWSDQGHRVLVLDGSSREQAHAPGLAQVLSDESELHRSVLRVSTQLHLLASASGIEILSQKSEQQDFDPVQAITEIGANYDVVVLMASADHLALLLRGTNSAPLVSLNPDEKGVFSSYAAIKKIVARSGLRGALLAVNHPQEEPLAEQIWRGAQRIQECARQFLDCEVEIQIVERHHTVAGAPINVFPLASRTLGQALVSNPSTRM